MSRCSLGSHIPSPLKETAYASGYRHLSTGIRSYSWFLYLVLLVVGPFSLLYVDGALVAPGDATTTANNIVTSEFLFRLGLAGHGVTLLADLGIAVLLYLLFRPVNKALSMTALYARLEN